MNLQRVLSTLSITLAVSAPAIAAPTGYQISAVTGQANVKAGQIVRPGQPVKTQGLSIVKARLHNLGVNTLQYPSTFSIFESLFRTPQGGWVGAFNVIYGMIDFHVGKIYNPTSMLIIRSKEGTTEVTGTRLAVFNDGRVQRIGVQKGFVETTANSVTVKVQAGQWSEFSPGRPPTPPQKAHDLTLQVVKHDPPQVIALPGNTLWKDGQLLQQPSTVRVCDRVRVVSPLSTQIYQDWIVNRAGTNCPPESS